MSPMHKKTNFEENIKKLEEIVRKLEKGEISLEESLAVFEEGVALVRDCQNQLDKVAERIKILAEDGRPIETFKKDEE